PFGGQIGTGRSREEQDELVKKLTDEQVVAAMTRGTDALLQQVQQAAARLDESAQGQRAATQQFGPIPLYSIEQGSLALGVYALLVLHKVTGDERLHFDSKDMAPAVKKVVEMQSN